MYSLFAGVSALLYLSSCWAVEPESGDSDFSILGDSDASAAGSPSTSLSRTPSAPRQCDSTDEDKKLVSGLIESQRSRRRISHQGQALVGAPADDILELLSGELKSLLRGEIDVRKKAAEAESNYPSLIKSKSITLETIAADLTKLLERYLVIENVINTTRDTMFRKLIGIVEKVGKDVGLCPELVCSGLLENIAPGMKRAMSESLELNRNNDPNTVKFATMLIDAAVRNDEKRKVGPGSAGV